MGLAKIERPFEWTNQCKIAYQYLITGVSSDPVLTLPGIKLPFKLNTDASHYVTGAVLYHRHHSTPESTNQGYRILLFHLLGNTDQLHTH